jgi:hypothetical protein
MRRWKRILAAVVMTVALAFSADVSGRGFIRAEPIKIEFVERS